MPKANNNVPIPTVPPKYHPIETTLISIKTLTAAIGKLVICCKPIIKPSLGPGPKFATRYIPPPNPTISTAKIAIKICKVWLSGEGTNLMHRSIIMAIIKALKIVPIPGFCLRGIHKNNTPMLINKVINPIEKSTFRDIPCANTLQGEAPVNDTINNPSPNPNSDKPKHKKKKVEKFGLRLNGFFELQKVLGTFLIDKSININFFDR